MHQSRCTALCARTCAHSLTHPLAYSRTRTTPQSDARGGGKQEAVDPGVPRVREEHCHCESHQSLFRREDPLHVLDLGCLSIDPGRGVGKFGPQSKARVGGQCGWVGQFFFLRCTYFCFWVRLLSCDMQLCSDSGR